MMLLSHYLGRRSIYLTKSEFSQSKPIIVYEDHRTTSVPAYRRSCFQTCTRSALVPGLLAEVLRKTHKLRLLLGTSHASDEGTSEAREAQGLQELGCSKVVCLGLLAEWTVQSTGSKGVVRAGRKNVIV